MGLEFLREHGARRVRTETRQPQLVGDGIVLSDTDDRLDWSYEVPAEKWEPQSISSRDENADAHTLDTWPTRPRRFIDGKDVGRTVAWLRSREGFPVPVRLSEVGAVALRSVEQDNAPASLCREWTRVERVVSLMIDFFPWEEIESFARALAQRGFRLLPVEIPRVRNSPSESLNLFDYERMRQATHNRTLSEMRSLEREALAHSPDVPVIVDGDLKPHANAFDAARVPVTGVIKSHSTNYLHLRGWQTFYALQPGERTPAFVRKTEHISLVSWYLRLGDSTVDAPNQGVVRVEIAHLYFESQQKRNPVYLDQISRLLRRYRCRNEDYGRASVSLAPIVRAEQSLESLFTASDTLTSRFYHLTGL